MSSGRSPLVLMLALAGLTVPSTTRAALVPARVVTAEGTIPAGASELVAEPFAVFVNEAGEPSLTGQFNDGNHFVFIGDEVVWLESEQVGVALENIGNDMGSNALGEFVLGLDVNGVPGLWTHDGELVRAGDGVPGFDFFPQASFLYFFAPTIDALGNIYWQSSVDLTGDDSTDVAGLFRAPLGDPTAMELVIGSGDTVDGMQLGGDEGAFSRRYAVSSENDHLIGVFRGPGGSSGDEFVVVDEVVVAREGDSLPPPMAGNTWQSFDLVDINAAGNYVFFGDTSASSNADAVIAYNGVPAVREGDVVNGLTLTSSPMFVAINDYDHAAFGWRIDASSDYNAVQFACDASNLGETAQLVLSEGDQLDIDDDGLPEFTVELIRGNPFGGESDQLGTGPSPVFMGHPVRRRPSSSPPARRQSQSRGGVLASARRSVRHHLRDHAALAGHRQ